MARQKERREFLRRDCLMWCCCDGKGFRRTGVLVDISFGGAGIVGTKQLPTQGANLQVTIGLPAKMVELVAEVAWTRSTATERGLADFGVEFLDSLPEKREKLEMFFPQYNADVQTRG